jgi:hypothetical protein
MGGEYAACGESGEAHTGSLGRKMSERDDFEDVSIDGRIILKCILKMSFPGRRLVSCCSGYGPVADCCECGYEPSVCRKDGEFMG